MSEKVMIDTSILLNTYFLVNKKNKEKAIEIIEKYANTGNGYISMQNIIEYINICKNKFKVNKKDLDIHLSEIKILFNVVNHVENSLEAALKLSYLKKISFLDALLAQTMIDNNIKTIYTVDNRVFKSIKEIKAINPFKWFKEVIIKIPL